MLGWPKGSFQVDLGLKAGLSLKNGLGSFLKYRFVLILCANSSKSDLSSGSLILFYI